MLGFGQARGSPLVFPNPDGSFGTEDRSQLLYLYAGIALGDGSGGLPASQNYLFRRRRSDR